jgi:hypothetical protein
MMARSVDLMDIIDREVYYINWSELKIEKEVLIPVCNKDWYWYSVRNNVYMLEGNLYDTEKEAAEVLLGSVISLKKEALLFYASKERELIDLMNDNKIEKVV